MDNTLRDLFMAAREDLHIDPGVVTKVEGSLQPDFDIFTYLDGYLKYRIKIAVANGEKSANVGYGIPVYVWDDGVKLWRVSQLIGEVPDDLEKHQEALPVLVPGVDPIGVKMVSPRLITRLGPTIYPYQELANAAIRFTIDAHNTSIKSRGRNLLEELKKSPYYHPAVAGVSEEAPKFADIFENRRGVFLSPNLPPRLRPLPKSAWQPRMTAPTRISSEGEIN